MSEVGRYRLSTLSVAALVIAFSVRADSSSPKFVRTTAECVLLRNSIPSSLDDRTNTVCTNKGFGWKVVETYVDKQDRVWYRVRNLVTTDTGWLASWYTEPVEIQETVVATNGPVDPRHENDLVAARLANTTARVEYETAKENLAAVREQAARERERDRLIRLAAILGIVAAAITGIAYLLYAIGEALKLRDRANAQQPLVESEIESPLIAFPSERLRAARKARRERRRNPSVYHGMSADGPWSIPVERVQGNEH